MPATKLNLPVEQGANFIKSFTLKDSKRRPINLTGYTARMQVRPSVASEQVIVELSTANGKIVITPLIGLVKLQLTAAETQVLSSGVYDLELVDASGFVIRLLEGKFTVSPEVTR